MVARVVEVIDPTTHRVLVGVFDPENATWPSEWPFGHAVGGVVPEVEYDDNGWPKPLKNEDGSETTLTPYGLPENTTFLTLDLDVHEDTDAEEALTRAVTQALAPPDVRVEAGQEVEL